MAALQDRRFFRRHARLVPFVQDIRPSTGGPGPRPLAREMPRIVAAWHVGADGRLACTWSVRETPEVRLTRGPLSD